MIKMLANLLLLVLNNCLLELAFVAPALEMLLLFILTNDLTAVFAFC